MRKCTHVLVAGCLTLAASVATAEVYRVGPGEEYPKISDVAHTLHAGDTVEVTGDIVDHFTLTAHGTYDKPVTIRGVTRVEDGAIVRPRVTLSTGVTSLATCKGNRTVLEGLDLDGGPSTETRRAIGVRHVCDDLTIRNCRFRNFSFKAIIGAPEAGGITMEFCEFDSNGAVENLHTVDIWSFTPGATMRVEHCWFHDGTGGALLKSHAPRNVIRYNWFENPYSTCLAVVDVIAEPVFITDSERSSLYPMHSDIVGNVFFQGWSPGAKFAALRLGGESRQTPGTEGDFHIAHNLFVNTTSRTEVTPPDEPAAVHLRVNGNVDRIRAYNNVFLEYGVSETGVYMPGKGWDTPRTTAFRERRGHGEPIVEGANNWVSVKTVGIPEGLVNTLRGINPHFVDLVNFDFRPAKDSPLAGAGLWPLPQGRIVELAPEYEPQRGIPADLKPVPRRKATPPAIGPFEPVE